MFFELRASLSPVAPLPLSLRAVDSCLKGVQLRMLALASGYRLVFLVQEERIGDHENAEGNHDCSKRSRLGEHLVSPRVFDHPLHGTVVRRLVEFDISTDLARF